MDYGQQHWNHLHKNPRFRPLYPNDHVVRFMMANRPSADKTSRARFLDIGTGAGRHSKLATDLEFETYGIDISLVGLQHSRERLSRAGTQYFPLQASMTALPFADCSFDLVLSFGVFNYGTKDQMKLAIKESHRILANNGKIFAVTRTTDDYRFGKGKMLEPQTFELNISDTNEFGTTQHFVTAEDIPDYFSEFTKVSFEKTETSFAALAHKNSDWLITAER